MADPKLTIVSPVKDQEVFITTTPAMPEVEAQVKIEGVTPDPTGTTTFDWTANISFLASSCAHGKVSRTITHPEVKESVAGGKWKPKFTAIRGGALTITVAANIGGKQISTSVTVKIGGTNPTKGEILAKFPDKLLRQIAGQESGMRQFQTKAAETKSICPLWSADNLGGVGLMQITNPAPADDEVWSWLSNMTKGQSVLASKKTVAKNFASQVRNAADFKKLVDAFNKARTGAGQKALTIAVPDFTAEQLEHDTIRGYNGYGGKDRFGFPLHEYRIKVEAAGTLAVTDNGNGTGTAQWEVTPVADRPQKFGDANYVSHVLAQSV